MYGLDDTGACALTAYENDSMASKRTLDTRNDMLMPNEYDGEKERECVCVRDSVRPQEPTVRNGDTHNKAIRGLFYI